MGIDDMTDPRVRLRRLLTERPEYQIAYQNSALFKTSVDSIINILPLILRAAYEEAETSKATQAKMVEALESGPLITDKGTERLLGIKGSGGIHAAL